MKTEPTKSVIRNFERIVLIAAIRRWCLRVARGAEAEIGYDGFGSNSFRKGPPDITDGFLTQVQTLEEYRAFIRLHVERPRAR